jgi:hypothetical protein
MHTMSMFVDVFGEDNELLVCYRARWRRLPTGSGVWSTQTDEKMSFRALCNCVPRGSAGAPEAEELAIMAAGADLRIGVHAILLTNTSPQRQLVSKDGPSIVGEHLAPEANNGEVLIVEARFCRSFEQYAGRRCKGCSEGQGHEFEVNVPGALEIPGTIAMAADSSRWLRRHRRRNSAAKLIISKDRRSMKSARGIMALTMILASPSATASSPSRMRNKPSSAPTPSKRTRAGGGCGRDGLAGVKIVSIENDERTDFNDRSPTEAEDCWPGVAHNRCVTASFKQGCRDGIKWNESRANGIPRWQSCRRGTVEGLFDPPGSSSSKSASLRQTRSLQRWRTSALVSLPVSVACINASDDRATTRR